MMGLRGGRGDHDGRERGREEGKVCVWEKSEDRMTGKMRSTKREACHGRECKRTTTVI